MNTEGIFLKTMSNPSYKYELNKTDYFFSPPDSKMITIVLCLIIVGLLAIFSAGAPKCAADGLESTFFVQRQFNWFLIGIFFTVGISFFPYRLLDKLAIPFAYVVLLLLVGVEVAGVTVNGATRWLALGPIQFQPSEAAKLSVIMLLASAFSRSTNIFNLNHSAKYLFPIALMLIFILKQPNLSMVIILCLSSLFMFFAAGGSLKVVFSSIALGVLGVFVAIQSFQKQRILTWLNPEADPYGAGYNIIQAMMAFVSGGVFGVGYGNSSQKLGWLPEGHTDFIFAIFGEEFGFLGCFLVIGLFIAFLQRGLKISSRCEDTFGKLLAAGITVSITVQALINFGVSSSMIPATGVPLPFISYGGTSLFMTMLMVGILLNVSKKKIRRLPTNVQ